MNELELKACIYAVNERIAHGDCPYVTGLGTENIEKISWYKLREKLREKLENIIINKSEDKGMTKEQKDKLIKLLAEDRNKFANDCNKRIAEECGKITGADYMFQSLLDILGGKAESEGEE